MVRRSSAARRLARFRPLWPVLLLAATPAWAGDTPRYEAAPAWVNRAQSLPATADEQGIVLFDRAFRIEDGQLWSFTDLALKITSPEMLSQAGTVSIQWQPDHGDAVIHRLEIVRDGQVIDALGDQRFEILRREQGLERLSLDGQLTATHQVQGLRIGDTLRFSSSTVERDPVLDGHVQLIGPLIPEPVKLGDGKVRLSWPKDEAVTWKLSGVAGTPQPVADGGFLTLTVDQPVAKLPEAPEALPMRLVPVALFEATTFRDWDEVSSLGARLFAPAGLIADGSDLARRTDAIAAAGTDPAVRAAGALRLVQDDVRYLFNGLSGGNYRPQTPAETWEKRYGDCKAKTLLLLAMLDRLGLPAEAAFVNSQMADAVFNRVPSFAAFDHVLVRADIGGRTAWLDGTRTGDRLVDLYNAPPFRMALPARATGGGLLPIAAVAPGRPDIDLTLAYDASAGLALPALFQTELTLHNGAGLQMRSAIGAMDKRQADKTIDGLVTSTIGEAVVRDRSWRFDEDAGALVITASGVRPLDWTGEGGQRDLDLETVLGSAKLDAARYGDRWGDAPVAVPSDNSYHELQTIRLPASAGPFVLEGERTLDGTFGGLAVRRALALDGDRVTFDESRHLADWEIPAAALPAERERLAQANAESLRVVAPADAPSAWAEIARARQSGRIKPILAAYDAQVEAADPDDPAALLARAWFLQSIYDNRAAAADYTRAIAIKPDDDTLARRGYALAAYDSQGAAKDLEAALALDPTNQWAMGTLFELRLDEGDIAGARALAERAGRSGVDADTVAMMRSDVLAADGKVDEGLALLVAATQKKATQPAALNSRCWYKARARVELASALKDCTRAIELGSEPAQYLDSRALTYLQMGRPEEAIADADAALALLPDLASSLYLRGVARKRLGQPGAAADLDAAAAMEPRLPARYARYGVKP